MKNLVSLIIISLIITSCQKQEEVIKNHLFVNEHIKTLDNDSKTLIVEFWAPTCSPCIKLKNDIFDNDQNLGFLNENFVLVKVSPSDSIYKSLYKYYNLNAQSSVLFFNTNGAEIERSVGYDGNKDAYMSFLNDITKRENLYNDLYKNYVDDSTDLKYNYLLAKKLLFRYENKKAIEHFNYILKNDSDNEYGYHSECLFRIAEYEFLNRENIKDLECYVNSFSDNEFSPQAYLYLINHFKNKNDHKGSVTTSAEALCKFPFNADLLNKHAWNIYLFKIEEDYKEALEMIDKAISINPNNAGYWDTQAWLYFEIGESEKAAQSEQKAVDLYPHSAYKQALKKFKSV
jgi:tetratricopeptide (TPR) repeat protein